MTPEGPVRVVVADDHPVFREGLRALLEGLGAQVVGEAEDGFAAVDAVARERPDVVLMDLHMPGLSGAEATARISRDHPDTSVLVLTMSDAPESVQAALAAGARGYLLKEAGREEIARTLTSVRRGELVIGAGAASRLRGIVAAQGNSTAFPQLTSRERDLLELMARGLDNNAIARRLFLAEKTVRNRVSAVLAKLEVTSRVEAVTLARDAGLGEPTG